MQSGHDLHIVRLVLLCNDSMPHEEINQYQRRVGFKLAPRHGLSRRLQVPQVELLHLVVPRSRHHGLRLLGGHLKVVAVYHVGDAKADIESSHRDLPIRHATATTAAAAAASRLSDVRNGANGPYVLGHKGCGQRRLLVRLVDDALKRGLLGPDAAGDGVVQHSWVGREVAAPAGHPELVSTAVGAPEVHGHVCAAVRDAEEGGSGTAHLDKAVRVVLIVWRAHDPEVLALGLSPQRLQEEALVLGESDQAL